MHLLSQDESHKYSEIQKMRGLLGLQESDLEFLSPLKLDQLSFLRLKITNAILEEQSGIWEPLARVSKFMPNFLNAKVSEDILGPQIAANITYHMPPKDALGIASHFSTKFFCDVLEHIIPEKIEHIIRESPFDLMKKVIQELRKRNNYLLIGSLIDVTPMNIVYKISMETTDLEMIHIMDFIMKRDRLVELLEAYDENRILNLIKISIQLNKMEGLLESFSYTKVKTREKIENVLPKLSLEEIKKLKPIAETYNITLY